MFRGVLIFSLLSAAAGSPGSAAPGPARPAAVITVAPLRGPSGARCAAELDKILEASMAVERWGDARGVAGFESFAALSKFIEARGQALGADIVVVGTARKKKLILEAYDVRTGALLNIQRVPISPKLPGCTVGRRGQTLVRDFAARAEAALARRSARAEVATSTATAEPEALARAAPKPSEAMAPKPARGTEAPIPEPEAPAAPPTLPAAAPAEASAEPRPGAPLARPGHADLLREDPAPKPEATVSKAKSGPLRSASTPWVELDPEVGLGQRKFTFSDPTGATVASYQIGAMFTPGLRAKVRPFVKRAGLLRALEAELVFHQSTQFSSRRVAGGQEVDTRFVEAAGLLRYPIRIPGSRFSATPELGAHFSQYSLRGVAGGASSGDTPSVRYESLLLGLGLEAPVVEQADIRIGAAYLPVLSAGQVFSSTYYPEGSAWALRVEASLSVYVRRWLVVVVTGHYLSYQMDLKGTQEGRPASATDRTTGLRLGLRIAL